MLFCRMDVVTFVRPVLLFPSLRCTLNGVGGSHGNSCLLLAEELRNYAPKFLCSLHSLVTCEGPSVSTCSLVFVFLSNYNHPSGCEIVCQCGFDLHFPND